MQKPDIDLSTLSFGKIFQIDPIGTDDVQVKYGGDFLIATEYADNFVMGYLANVYESPTLNRFKGLAFLKVEWKYLECVGCVHWFKQGDKDGKA